MLLAGGLSADFYHAGLERSERLRSQQRFQCGETQILCATTAFGMGVDIPDIRRIIHDDLPDSVIDYVQQTGRGGRDGQMAECILYLEPRQLVRRAEMRKQMRHKIGSVFQRQLQVFYQRRKLRKLLQVLLTEPCIPKGLAKAFGQRVKTCGCCCACQHGAMLSHVPDIGGMREWQVRAFLLQWQRDALAAKLKCSAGQVMPDAALIVAAKHFTFPPEYDVPEELNRLCLHFLGKSMHEYWPEWIE